jgi:type II secretory pathway pseudopilin PulG
MSRSGFTVLELVVLVAVLVASAALVYPVVSSERLRADRASAEEQCRLIALAIQEYLQDRTNEAVKVPVDPLTGRALHWLIGPGEPPHTNPFRDGAPNGLLADILLKRDPKIRAWSGPHIERLEPDPWGRAYLVNTHGLTSTTEQTWILSAGPNGVVETTPDSRETGGDDIGRMLP